MSEVLIDMKHHVDFIEEAIDNVIRIARYKMTADFDHRSKLLSFTIISRIEKYKVINMTDANNIFISVPKKYRNKCIICGKKFEPGEVYSHFNTDLFIPNMMDYYDWDAWYEAHLDCIYKYFDPENHKDNNNPEPLYRIALQSIYETSGFILKFGVFVLITALIFQYYFEKWSGQSVLWPEYITNYILNNLWRLQ